MTPAARLQMTIVLLDGLGQTQQPLDRFLRDWFRARRFAGSKDRRAIADHVFAIMRGRAALAWRMQGDDPRSLIIASVLAEGGDPAMLFTGEGYGPPPLTPAEIAAIAKMPGAAPAHVRGEYPEFLAGELARAFGADLPQEMTAMQTRAPTDLRANTLKTTRDALLADLAALDIAAKPTPYAPHGVRLRDGGAGLGKMALFESGAFEFQDEAAQIAACLCRARPGESVLDLAAGAGGKSLALAADMRNQGTILACDIRGEALHQLSLRAARAGASMIGVQLLDDEAPNGPFDAIFVDAPCSGSGVWRRQPEQKWRLTPQRLATLTEIQDGLLDRAAARLAPQGRIIYATCSILPCENEDRIEAFLARHPQFAVEEAAKSWDGPPIAGLGRFFRASPRRCGMDGFFCAILVLRDTGPRITRMTSATDPA